MTWEIGAARGPGQPFTVFIERAGEKSQPLRLSLERSEDTETLRPLLEPLLKEMFSITGAVDEVLRAIQGAEYGRTTKWNVTIDPKNARPKESATSQVIEIKLSNGQSRTQEEHHKYKLDFDQATKLEPDCGLPTG